MDLVDSKYVGLISSRLQKFKRVKNDLYNFRCPICGDSQKNKNKTRGYIYTVKNNTNFKCHNCGASLSLNNFIKKLDPELHHQYTLEKFKEGFAGKNFAVKEPEFKFKEPVFRKKIDLPKASEVKESKEYLEKRLIDPSKFYYAHNFREWVNTQKYTFDNVTQDESRIIIPMYDNENNLIGFQGRSIRPSRVKYITIMLNDDAPKIYGLDKINREEKVYITEGPFDSSFIRNSIALCGADGFIDKCSIKKRVWIYDNEPRNQEIVKRISKRIDSGEEVVIWPSSLEYKDINDMVIAGLNVMDMIESNSFKGLEAKVKFNEWKKV
jgi:predicted RNA-binding Zn-ribbon protein involved in translation (DUF1610 family)